MSVTVVNQLASETIPIVDTTQTISALRYHLPIPAGTGFDIYIDSHEQDGITKMIATQTYTFPETFSLLLELVKPGRRVLDLGAHIGTFSLFAAALGYQVVSVEASPRNAALLQKSVSENGFDNVQVISVAVGDNQGILEFIDAGPYSLAANPFLDSPTISVAVTTVDDLLADIGWDKVDFIKLDVEGSEAATIQGMLQLLAGANAPIILYEANGHTLHYFGQRPERLMASLEKVGYQCYLIEPSQLITTQSDELQPEAWVDYLAVKQTGDILPHWTRWQIRSPLTVEERIAKILSSCIHPQPPVRTYIARALAGAGESLLADRRIINALQMLKADPVAEVRAATAWWPETDESLYDQIRDLRRELMTKEIEIASLRALVNGYEAGRFIRTMRYLHELWHKIYRFWRFKVSRILTFKLRNNP